MGFDGTERAGRNLCAVSSGPEWKFTGRLQTKREWEVTGGSARLCLCTVDVCDVCCLSRTAATVRLSVSSSSRTSRKHVTFSERLWDKWNEWIHAEWSRAFEFSQCFRCLYGGDFRSELIYCRRKQKQMCVRAARASGRGDEGLQDVMNMRMSWNVIRYQQIYSELSLDVKLTSSCKEELFFCCSSLNTAAPHEFTFSSRLVQTSASDIYLNRFTVFLCVSGLWYYLMNVIVFFFPQEE